MTMQNKPILVFAAPILTRSGYGDHARDLLRALKEMDNYDIKIIATNWGNTPNTELQDGSEFADWVKPRIQTDQLTSKPDVFIQVTVPNEFKPLGNLNIGITAGIETTVAPKEFVDGCNNMDMIIVPSEFSKKVLQDTVYEERHKQTKQVVATHKVTKPIHVLFEGVDLEVYGKSHGHSLLEEVEEDFCFLFVGHWLKGDHGQDRKDIGGLIETFCAVFSTESIIKHLKGKKPALVLKTSTASFSVLDRERIWNKIKRITDKFGENCPSIYLLHGDLTVEEMSSLYHDDKVKAMVSFTKGEGYGRPLCEFTITGKPVIASNWSGHLDFLSSDNSVLLEGEVKQVHPSCVDKFIIKEAGWFNVNYSKAGKSMLDVLSNYPKYLNNSKVLQKFNKSNFSLVKMRDDFKKLMEKHAKVKTFREFKMPKLD